MAITCVYLQAKTENAGQPFPDGFCVHFCVAISLSDSLVVFSCAGSTQYCPRTIFLREMGREPPGCLRFYSGELCYVRWGVSQSTAYGVLS
jgi:hypothetical protein